MTASALDGIPGLGVTRRKALLREFGSLKRLGSATADEIVTVPGIGRRTAEAIVAALAGPPDAVPRPAEPGAAAAQGPIWTDPDTTREGEVGADASGAATTD